MIGTLDPTRFRSRRAAAQLSQIDESAYRLIPPPAAAPIPPPLHQSRYPFDTPPSSSTFGTTSSAPAPLHNLTGDYSSPLSVHRSIQSHSNFGPKNHHYSDPTNWLKKNSLPDLPTPKKFEYRDTRKKKLDTKGKSLSIMNDEEKEEGGGEGGVGIGLSSKKKDFISENALSVIYSKPPPPTESEVNYLKKSDYGAVPSYLNRVKEEIAAEKNYIREIIHKNEAEARSDQPRISQMSEDDRLSLLQSLKNKWELLNRQYQSMTHLNVLDTIGKKGKKEKFEKELLEIERAIEKLTKQNVFIHHIYGAPI